MTNAPYAETEPARAEVDALPGAVLLEFGTNWCGHCRRAQTLIFLSGGKEVERLVRPAAADLVRAALAGIDGQ